MNAKTSISLIYHTYNSMFLELPFQGIAETGTHLALFSQACRVGLEEGRNPDAIVQTFWDTHFSGMSASDRYDQLFHFVQYLERQVVLFDSVEDALFGEVHDPAGAGSLTHLLNRLETEEQVQALQRLIDDFSVRLVLTAHPTQFYPGKVLGIINDLGEEIRNNRLGAIRLLLMQLGKTAFVNRQQPTPYDEAISLGWYLENVFYHALPDILYRLLEAVGQDVVSFRNPKLLTLGFWPGGDRDGNPFVTTETTLLVARRLRESILRCYHRDLRLLRRRLTFRGIEDRIADAEQKINNTLYYPGKEQYTSAAELISDLVAARDILIREHDSLFLEELDRFILKVNMFGLYFASLDIRQDSRKHGEVWKQVRASRSDFDSDAFMRAGEQEQIDLLLETHIPLSAATFEDSFTQETIRSMQAIREIQAQNGEEGCHRYIISNCQSALHVAEVLALIRCAQGVSPEALLPLDIVPLFETVDDLARAADIMKSLYTNRRYAAHLASRGNRQTIMLGFSDGTKDGGYLQANWSIYRAKAALSAVSRAYGVEVRFFDGRGGPPGRGGGNNVRFYAAHGPEIARHGIQVTIQGQTVSSTYGTKVAARYHTERLLVAGLESRLFPVNKSALDPEDAALMDRLADAAYRAYLELKQHPAFVPYLEHATPLKWYGDTKIASRPTRRGPDGALRFEDLRAIPFVGAWAQMKQNIPGYFGFGSALEALCQEGEEERLKAMYRRSPFLQALVENSMQSLSKSNFAPTRYLGEDARFSDFWKRLEAEYLRTKASLLNLSGSETLLAGNPVSRESIGLREEIVLPLILIQQFALQQLPNADAGQEQMLRRLVLRAMIGIINAARNAA